MATPTQYQSCVTRRLTRNFHLTEATPAAKPKHWFIVYDNHLSRYCGKEVTLLACGTGTGEHLSMWRTYLGSQAKIHAVVAAADEALATEGIELSVGDPNEAAVLEQLATQVQTADVLVLGTQLGADLQVTAFEELYPLLAADGICFVEDLQVVAKSGQEGFITYSKDFIDQLNAWHSDTDELRVNDFTRSTYALHYYDGIMAIERKVITEPIPLEIGKRVIFYGWQKIRSKEWRHEARRLLWRKFKRMLGLQVYR